MPVRCLDVEQVPEGELLGVVGAGGVARGRPDAGVLLRDQVLVGELLVVDVAPELGADPLVEPLGERLGEPVGQRLDQDRVVVVEVVLERLDPLRQADAGGDREPADVVGADRCRPARRSRRATVGDAVAVLALLAQVVQHGAALERSSSVVDDDVVAVGVGREEAVDAAGGQPLLGDDLVEHLLGVVVELARRLAAGRAVEDVGELALHLPGVEERLPVDVARAARRCRSRRGRARRAGGAAAGCSRPSPPAWRWPAPRRSRAAAGRAWRRAGCAASRSPP